MTACKDNPIRSPDDCASCEPTATLQDGHRYVGHWHGQIAVYGDAIAFRAGHGWLGYEEACALIPSVCQEHARGALRISDYA